MSPRRPTPSFTIPSLFLYVLRRLCVHGTICQFLYTFLMKYTDCTLLPLLLPLVSPALILSKAPASTYDYYLDTLFSQCICITLTYLMPMKIMMWYLFDLNQNISSFEFLLFREGKFYLEDFRAVMYVNINLGLMVKKGTLCASKIV